MKITDVDPVLANAIKSPIESSDLNLKLTGPDLNLKLTGPNDDSYIFIYVICNIHLD